MRKAKTIDQIYQEVRSSGADYVITCDAPLATALNAMIDVDQLDGFAYTPKAIAGALENMILQTKTLSDLEIIESIERDTSYDFRYIHSEIQNIRDIRRYTSDVEKYLYTRKSKEVYEYFRQLPTSTKVMDIYDPTVYRSFLTGKKVAVVGLDLFDDLDKHFIPMDFIEIDPFTDEEYEIDTIHAIGNDRQIAGSIVDLIDANTSNDTAIVLDSKAPIADAIRSAMYRKHIPFKNSLDVKDLSQIRDFIQFLTLALDYGTLRAGDVRELFSTYQTGFNKNRGSELRPEYDRYLLSRVPLGDDVEPVTARLMGAMSRIRDLTFWDAKELLFTTMPQKTSVEILLKNMKLEDRKVTPALVGRLTYAVNNIEDLKHNEQVPEEERKGVLLADCKNSVYVDRPFVIFIGLDESWENTAPGKDYVDKELLDEQNAYRMSILLQQGTSRIYAVKPVTKGKETAPCPTFQTMYRLMGRPKSIGSFKDLCGNYVTGSWYREEARDPVLQGEEIVEPGTEREVVFSKSSYNAYSDCPLKFMFNKLIPGEDNEYTVFGNCLHEFAEFYFCYPELVREKGIPYYVGELGELYAGMSSECQKGLDSSRFRVYLNNIIRYIDRIRPPEVPLDTDLADRKYPNLFMQKEGLNRCSSYTESKLPSSHPLFAKFDVQFGNEISDYKSGKAKEPAEIMEGFTRRGKKLSEFQALIYLQVLSEHVDGPCRFRLFYLGDNDIESVREDFDIMRNVRTVILCRESLPEIAFGPDGVLRNSLDSVQKYAELCSRWDELGPELVDMATERSLDAPGSVPRILGLLGMRDLKKNVDAISGLLKKASDLMGKKYPIDRDGNVLVPSDSMADFLRQVDEDHVTATRELTIPIYDLKKGNMNCRKCSYFKACMKADIAADDEEESE